MFRVLSTAWILLGAAAAFLASARERDADAAPEEFDVGYRYVRDVYVDGAASRRGDGSRDAPFRTIAEGLRAARPGTRVRIAAGSYPAVGTIPGVQGTAQAPVAIVGDGEVVIDARGGATGLHLVDPRYVVIEGLTVRNSVPHGISIDDGSSYSTPAHHVVLRNISISGIGNGGNNDCLKLSGVDDFRVEGSRFAACNRGEGIDMVGCHRGLITGNVFTDMPGIAVQAKGGSADVLIFGNRFARIGQRAINAGGMTGEPWFRPLDAADEAARIRMLANVIEDVGGAPVVFAGCRDCVFANNTILRPGDFVARIVRENPGRGYGGDGYFVNNMILFDRARLRGYVDVRPGTRPSTYTFGWNFWRALDDARFAGPVYPAALPVEQGGIAGPDPRLDALLRPLSGSPAIAAGRAVPGGPAVDFDGRTYGDPPSIGAFAGP